MRLLTNELVSIHIALVLTFFVLSEWTPLNILMMLLYFLFQEVHHLQY